MSARSGFAFARQHFTLSAFQLSTWAGVILPGAPARYNPLIDGPFSPHPPRWLSSYVRQREQGCIHKTRSGCFRGGTMESSKCLKTATWGGAVWVLTRSSPARSDRWWEHSRSNVLNVELRQGLPAAKRRGNPSTIHTRPAESVRTVKPWVPHTNKNIPVHAHNDQDRGIHLPACSCTTTRCVGSRARGVKSLRSHPHASQRGIYARF
jgi:hypothetical protein